MNLDNDEFKILKNMNEISAKKIWFLLLLVELKN